MKVIAINGSPRQEWNTGTLLKKALEGAASAGALTRLVHLYELDFKGCVSCFACKAKDGKSYGTCVVQDGLTPLLGDIRSADALIFGSPIYLGNVSGGMQSFLERLVFPYLMYTDPPGTLFPKKIPTGFIYTMGMPEDLAEKFGYEQRFDGTARLLTRIFGSAERLCSFDTYQFDDYSQVVAPRFDPAAKLERRKKVFPEDCRKAFEMGARLAAVKEAG